MITINFTSGEKIDAKLTAVKGEARLRAVSSGRRPLECIEEFERLNEEIKLRPHTFNIIDSGVKNPSTEHWGNVSVFFGRPL